MKKIHFLFDYHFWFLIIKVVFSFFGAFIFPVLFVGVIIRADFKEPFWICCLIPSVLVFFDWLLFEKWK